MPTWLALDIGERRIGLAAGSDDARLARPLGIITRRVKREEFAAIARIAAENHADRLLVGLPYNMDGSEGPQAKRIRNYVRLMERQVSLPVSFWDERLSSFAADEIIGELGRRRHPHNDAIAATLILQSFFDAQPKDG
ncbi:MAG: Holliday junction resolvase RuvX [Caldilineales bacterium]|nr:Holliday junction resolvase RuvX [Caldilineales bacterium]